MAQILGMDPTEVRNLATRLTQGADQINTLSQQLTQALESAPWVGSDRERYVSEWNSQHRVALNQIVSSLQTAAQTANQNAQQQEQTSNA